MIRVGHRRADGGVRLEDRQRHLARRLWREGGVGGVCC